MAKQSTKIIFFWNEDGRAVSIRTIDFDKNNSKPIRLNHRNAIFVNQHMPDVSFVVNAYVGDDFDTELQKMSDVYYKEILELESGVKRVKIGTTGKRFRKTNSWICCRV